MKFRKKPVVIEAWRNDPMSPPPEWVLEAVGLRNPSDGSLAIKTLEGVMIAKQGDWVIKGVAGEVYPCKPDIFVATYEPVTTQTLDPNVIYPGSPSAPGPSPEERS